MNIENFRPKATEIWATDEARAAMHAKVIAAMGFTVATKDEEIILSVAHCIADIVATRDNIRASFGELIHLQEVRVRAVSELIAKLGILPPAEVDRLLEGIGRRGVPAPTANIQ